MYIVLLFYILIANAFSSKILLLPSDDSERIRIFAPLSEALSVGGHEVLILSSSRHIDLLAALKLPHVLYSLPIKIQGGLDSIPPSQNFYRYLTFFERTYAKQTKICEELESSNILETLKDQNFNYAIIDGRREARCLKEIAARLKIRHSLLHSDFSSVDITYSPIHSGLIVEVFQRIILKFMYSSKLDRLETSDLHLINTDIVCSYNEYTLSPHMIHVNLMRSKTRGLLDSEIVAFLKKWKKSVVILFKRNPTKEQIISILNIFRMMSFGVIVEYRGQLKEVPDNVFISRILPLHELFTYSQDIVVIISVDGIYYQQLATTFGIPSIFVYQSFETYHLVDSYQKKNVILLENINPLEIEKAFDILGTFKKAKKITKQCSEKINAMPSPTKAAVFWIDHVIDFGSEHLKKNFLASASIVFKLNALDYSVLILSFLVLVFITFLCIKLTIFIVDLMAVRDEAPKKETEANETETKKDFSKREDKQKQNGIQTRTKNVKKTKKKKFY